MRRLPTGRVRRPRLPSPAMAVALAALVLAGTQGASASLLSSLISGTDIAPHTITESNILAKTLTAASIDVSRLGVVPEAINAQLLGGTPVGGLLRRDSCDDGTIKASAQLTYYNNSADLSFKDSTPFVSNAYDCATRSGSKILVRDKDWRAIVRVTGHVPGVPMVTGIGDSFAYVREVTPSEGAPNYREFEVTRVNACDIPTPVAPAAVFACQNAGPFTFALL